MQLVYEVPFERQVERTREYQFSVLFDSTIERLERSSEDSLASRLLARLFGAKSLAKSLA